MKESIERGDFVFKSIHESQAERGRIVTGLLLKDLVTTNNILKYFYNNTIAYFCRFEPLKCEWSEAPIDLAGILDLLCEVHGDELFEHGKKTTLYREIKIFIN